MEHGKESGKGNEPMSRREASDMSERRTEGWETTTIIGRDEKEPFGDGGQEVPLGERGRGDVLKGGYHTKKQTHQQVIHSHHLEVPAVVVHPDSPVLEQQGHKLHSNADERLCRMGHVQSGLREHLHLVVEQRDELRIPVALVRNEAV